MADVREVRTPKPAVGLGSNYRKVFTASVISNLGDGVSQIGYPWLASAVTRNPVLIATVAVAQKLPWLMFTLPAGVITDRVDRRRTMVMMDSCRAVLAAVVAAAVLGWGDALPAPDALKTVVGTRTGLYSVLLVSSLLLGMAEVLRDNCAQTIIPAIVAPEHLERANGRMWSAEQVSNTFAGPPLGSLLIGVAFFLPFALDAASFAAAAGIVALIGGRFVARNGDPSPTTTPGRTAWRADLKEGLRWLWNHSLLRPMAIILGLMNGLGALQMATLVLFAQEVLHTSAFQFAILSMGAAIGAVIGGLAASRIRDRIGSGPSLWVTLAVQVIAPVIIGASSRWPIVMVVFASISFTGLLWNVITVSLRQAIIPDHLLGRVNSVYRFFAWGMIPIGTAIGGVIVALAEPQWGRTMALRLPWFVSAAAGALLMVYAVPRLTTAKMDAARSAAAER